MKTLLVVDDNPEDREAIIRALRAPPAAAYLIHEAIDEHTCMNQLEQDGNVDCILLDYSMPGRDGLELLSLCLSNHPDVAIVMITGEGNEDVAVEALKMGAQDYVVKRSFSQTDIKQRVAKAIEHKDMALRLARQQSDLKNFADMLVHDLRAPLRSIKGPIEMLTKSTDPIENELRDQLFAFVTDGVDQMEHLIVSLRTYSEVQYIETTFEMIDTVQLVERVRAVLDHDLKASNAVLSLENGPPDIWGSRLLLTQLLQNLVDNAVKYNTTGAPQVHISVKDLPNMWSVEVEDNGIGISAEHWGDIYKPFKRLNRRETFKGTGLGLATCKRIAERHSASLSCRSERDIGTTFVLTLPKRGNFPDFGKTPSGHLPLDAQIN